MSRLRGVHTSNGVLPKISVRSFFPLDILYISLTTRTTLEFIDKSFYIFLAVIRLQSNMYECPHLSGYCRRNDIMFTPYRPVWERPMSPQSPPRACICLTKVYKTRQWESYNNYEYMTIVVKEKTSLSVIFYYFTYPSRTQRLNSMKWQHHT